MFSKRRVKTRIILKDRSIMYTPTYLIMEETGLVTLTCLLVEWILCVYLLIAGLSPGIIPTMYHEFKNVLDVYQSAVHKIHYTFISLLFSTVTNSLNEIKLAAERIEPEKSLGVVNLKKETQ